MQRGGRDLSLDRGLLFRAHSESLWVVRVNLAASAVPARLLATGHQ